MKTSGSKAGSFRAARFLAGVSISILLFSRAPVLRAQGRIEGNVLNATVDRPAVNQELRLLSPQGGMQQIAAARTDSAGHFSFGGAAVSPNSFYLVECRFAGVAYHAPVRFDSNGAASVEVKVYDTTSTEPALKIQSLQVLVRAEGPKLRVDRVYGILNASRPPRAYENSAGTFHFRLPAGGPEPRAAVLGLMDMPLPQPVAPGKSPGDFSIAYPVKPGLSRVVVSTETDYASPFAALQDEVLYPVQLAEVYVSPASLSVEAPRLTSAGVDSAKDVQKFEARDLPRETRLEVRVAGEAASAAPPDVAQTEAEVKVLPNSLAQVGLPVLACFLLVLFWALGVRVAKEWDRSQESRKATRAQKQFEAKVDGLLNSLVDLDELFASGKVPEKKYWKERLELKARLASALKNSSPSLSKSHVLRHTAP